MITLKILDDKEAKLDLLHDEYGAVIPDALKWRSWAATSPNLQYAACGVSRVENLAETIKRAFGSV